MFIFYIIVLLILSFRIDLFLTRFVRHDEKWVPSRFGAQIWYTKRLFVYLTCCNTTTLFMRATLIKLTRWTRPYLIQERDSIVAFMSPRQWGRHVFLMSSHDDDRNELWNSAPCMFVAFLPSSRTPSSVTPYLRSHKRKTWNSCHCSFWINDL